MFCAACSGLLIGAVTALTAGVLYFFVGINMAVGVVWLIALGEALMTIGLVQIKFAGYIKTSVNAGFVVGSFLTLAGADALGESILVDFYVLGLIVFLLWLRILLSEWNNERICGMCKSCFN